MAEDNNDGKNAMHRLREEALNTSVALSGPIEVLAKGGSKAQAAWAGFKDLITIKVLGPLTAATFLAVGFGRALWNAARNAETLGEGLRALAKVEALKAQFETLLGSVARAEERIRSLVEFVKNAPFSLDEAATANRNLQLLTGGMLATQAGMRMVGDAAVGTASGISDVSYNVGRFYEQLKNGQPIERSARELAAMGLISGETLRRLDDLQAAGGGFSAMWGLVQNDLQRFNGSMAKSGDTVDGLKDRIMKAQEELAAGKAESVQPQQKVELQADLATIQSLTPVMREFYNVTAVATNLWARFKAQLQLAAAQSGLLANTVRVALYGSLIAVVGILSAAIVRIGQFAVKVLSAITPLVQYIRENGLASVVTEQLAKAIGVLSNGMGYLAVAMKEAGFQTRAFENAQKALQRTMEMTQAKAASLANNFKNRGTAGAAAGAVNAETHAVEAAAEGAAGAAAAGATTSVIGRIKGMLSAVTAGIFTLGRGAFTVLKGLGAELVAAFLNPITIVMSAAAAIALYWSALKNASAESEEATRKANAMADAFRKQAETIKTADEKAQYMAQTLDELSQAQEAYNQAYEEYRKSSQGPINQLKLANAAERLSVAKSAVARGNLIRDDSLIPEQRKLDLMRQEEELAQRIADIRADSKIANAVNEQERLNAMMEKQAAIEERAKAAMAEHLRLKKDEAAQTPVLQKIAENEAKAGVFANPRSQEANDADEEIARLEDLAAQAGKTVKHVVFGGGAFGGTPIEATEKTPNLTSEQRSRLNELRQQKIAGEAAESGRDDLKKLQEASLSQSQQLLNAAAKTSNPVLKDILNRAAVAKRSDAEQAFQLADKSAEGASQLQNFIKFEDPRQRAAEKSTGLESQAIVAEAGRKLEDVFSLRRQESLGAIDAEADDNRRRQMENEFAAKFAQPGQVVASGLQRIGGGGGAAGSDPALRIQQAIADSQKAMKNNTAEMVSLLRQIAKARGLTIKAD
jgi:hypothetical protein